MPNPALYKNYINNNSLLLKLRDYIVVFGFLWYKARALEANFRGKNDQFLDFFPNSHMCRHIYQGARSCPLLADQNTA